MQLDVSSIGQTFNLETYLKIRYSSLTLMGFVPSGMMISLGLDPAAMHQQYASAMPPGGPTSYKDYSYLAFEGPDGQYVYLGTPWINPNTIEQVGHSIYNVRLINPSSQQLADLRNYLMTIGLTSFNISTE